MDKRDPWKHRSAGMTCATCMFFVEKVRTREVKGPVDANADIPAPPPKFGRCRRRAPTMNGFPAVFGTDWCGSHKLDENSL